MQSSSSTARHTWVPWVAGLAGAAFTLKVLLIAAAGDDVSDAVFGVLYLAGLALGLVAAVGAGLRQRGWARSLGVGIGAAVLLVMWIMCLGDLLKPVVGVVTDSETAKDEVPILLAGLVLLALAWRARARDLQVADEVPQPSRV